MLLNPIFALLKKLLSDSKRFLSEEEIESFAYIIAYNVIHHHQGQEEEIINVDDYAQNHES